MQECAPCDNCGWKMPEEKEDLLNHRHTYTTYEIYQGLRLTLCNFCDVDFSSYKPEYFGFTNNRQLGLTDFTFVKQLNNPIMVIDQFCTHCYARATFLHFLAAIREMNKEE
jgi:hypothetical protein